MVAKRTYSLTIEAHPAEGGYLAFFPALTGCHTWGETYEEAVKNAEEALALYVETLIVHGDPLPEEDGGSELASLEKSAGGLCDKFSSKKCIIRQNAWGSNC